MAKPYTVNFYFLFDEKAVRRNLSGGSIFVWLELVLIISRPIMSHILDLTLPDHDSGDSGETRTDKSSQAIPVLNPSRITADDSLSSFAPVI